MYIYLDDSCALNYFLITSTVLPIFISLSTVVIFVKNIKITLSVITMTMLQNFYTPIQNASYKIYLFRVGWEELQHYPHLTEKLKVVNCFVQNNMDKKLWIGSSWI